jgi:polyhydroxyalkanoate synthase
MNPLDTNDLFDKYIEYSHKFWQNFMHLPQSSQTGKTNVQDALMTNVIYDNTKWLEIQARYYQQQMDLWSSFLGVGANSGEQAPAKNTQSDKRFQAPEWQNPFFDYLRQSYLLSSKWMVELIESSKLEDEVKRKMLFFTKQYLDAVSPANFPATNPEVLKKAIETNGESLVQGMKNFLGDLDKGRISMTDESVFEVGKNLAITPGAVVFENELIQLIQYTPTTEKVNERPLLIVPPCINKYYILDLQPENSFVRYAVEQGNTVFMVSWRNIDSACAHLTWDDYLTLGVMSPIDVVRELTGVEKVNALGFCIGGALLECALAVMRAKNQDKVESVTLLTTMLDYFEPGEICVYLDEAFLKGREAVFNAGEIVPGRELAMAFASLRANELIWPYVVNNYLKGQTPPAFDLLYWNSDSTNLPGPMYAYYVRNLYIENGLTKPGSLTMCGVPIDLSEINLPTYIMSAREDHIVPWKTAYASNKLLTGDIEFVLASSGHIAGVVNHPAKKKRNFWVNKNIVTDPDHWMAGAQSHEGSWWVHWIDWLKQKSAKQVAARKLGSKKYREIEPAPGRYVKARGN